MTDKYLFSIPKSVLPGKIVVHNRVRPTMRLNARGFRAWLAEPSPGDYAVEVCPCGWAPHLGVHYRVPGHADHHLKDDPGPRSVT